MNKQTTQTSRFAKLLMLLAVCFLTAYHSAMAQAVSGTITIGSSGYTYTSITAAISAIKTSGVNGATILELESNYVPNGATSSETYPIIIPGIAGAGKTNTITIRPASGISSAIKIGSKAANGTFVFSGAQYVTIDGRPGGTGSSSSLIIVDSAGSTSSLADSATILFRNGSQYNTVTYCDVRGNQGYSSANSDAVIYIGNTLSGVGNSFNTISYCNIHATSSGNPIGCITINSSSSAGTLSSNNRNNTITHNNIYDFFSATASFAGIYIYYYTDSTFISYNSLYQTATRTVTSAGTAPRFMYINSNPLGSNTQTYGTQFVNNNTIGGNAPNAWTLSGTAPGCLSTVTISSATTTQLLGMYVANGVTIMSKIKNNYIQNISFSSTYASFGIPGLFTGIFLAQGTDSISNNTIGGSTANNINIVPGASAGDIAGIMTGGNGTISNTVYITGNTINNITAAGATAIYQHFFGIMNYSGSATTPTLNISGNTISNLQNGNSSTTATSANGQLWGICMYSAASGDMVSPTISSNTIYNLYNYMLSVGANVSSSTVGIGPFSSQVVSSPTINGNTIYNLNSMGAVATAMSNVGIMSAYVGTATISGNSIHSLAIPNSTASASIPFVDAIYLYTGAANVYNNAIRLGISNSGTALTTPTSFYGIYKANASNANIWFNSIYIGGTGVSANTGYANTAAIDITTAGTADVVEDNILDNVRTNSSSTTPAHYCLLYNTSISGLTLGYNVYNTASVTGSLSGNFLGAVGGGNSPAQTVSYGTNWGSTGDNNSQQGDPIFQNPIGNGTSAAGVTPSASTGVSLNIQSGVATPIESQGIVIPTVTIDIQGLVRAGYTPTDIGAYAGNFTGSLPSCSTVTLTTGTASASTTAFTCAGGGPVTLSLNGYTTAVIGLSYQWQSSPHGANTWTNISGAYSQTLNTYTTTSTDYQCVLTCNAGGGTTSNMVTVTVPTPINSLPYYQGFNTVPFSSSCWTSQQIVNNGTANTVSIVNAATTDSFQDASTGAVIHPAPYEGADYLDVNTAQFNLSNSVRVISPAFNTTAVSGTLQLQFANYEAFSFNGNFAASNRGTIQVQYSLDGINWINIGSAYSNYNTSSGWVPITVSLPAAVSGQSVVFIGFLCTTGSAAHYTPTSITSSDIMLDNINILLPCSGTPTAGTALSSATSACPGGFPVTLSLSGTTSGVYGLTYQWSSTTSLSNTYSPISGATSATYATSPTQTTYYECTVTCSNSSQSNTSSSITVNVVNNLPLPYTQGFNASPLSNYCWSSVQGTNNGAANTVSVVSQGNKFIDFTGNTIIPAPYAGSGFIDVNTAQSNAGNAIRVISPAFNTSGYNAGSPNLTFQYALYQGYAYDPAYENSNSYKSTVQLQYSTNGTTWTSIGSSVYNYNTTSGWYMQTATIPQAALNQSTVYFAFLCTAPASIHYGTPYVNDIMIDSISIQGPCSGTPTTGIAEGYTPVTLTGGSFNQMVIANGNTGSANPPANTTTAQIDSAGGYNLYDATYSYDGSTYQATALPANGQIVSNDNSGVLFQLNADNINNVMQLRYGSQTSGNLHLASGLSTTALYLLGVSGNGASSITAVVHFSDSTTQTFTGLSLPDMLNGSPYALKGFGRVSASGFDGTAPPNNPRLYDIALNLSISNYSETVSYVTITNNSATSAKSHVVNIFAVSAASTAPVTFCGGLNEVLSLYNSPAANLISGIVYQWQSSATNGGPYNNITGANNITYASSTAGTIYYVCNVTCTASGISTLSNQVTQVVNPTLNVQVTPSTAIYCSTQNTPVSLTASGATSYSWSPSATLTSGTAPNVNATPTVTTTYTVTGLTNGCTATATATIGYVATPTVSSISATPPTVCTGSTTQLSVNLPAAATYCTPSYVTGPGGAVYLTNVTLGTINNTTTALASPYYKYYNTMSTNLTAGSVYTITGTVTNPGYNPSDVAVWIDYNQDGIFTSNEQLGVFNLPYGQGTTYTIAFTVPISAINGTTRMRVRDVFNSTIIDPCNSYNYGDAQDYNVVISGGLSNTYTWTPGATLSSTTISNPVASPAAGYTEYKVSVATGTCSVLDSILVTSSLPLASNPVPTPAVVAHACLGTTYSLNAGLTGGGGPYTYSWTSSAGGFSATTASISVSPTTITTYSVTVNDNCGNQASGSYMFNPVLAPTTVIGASSNYCSSTPGDTLTVTGTSSSYTWAPSTNLSSTIGSTVYASPTTTVTYTVTGTDGYCTSTATTVVSWLSQPTIGSVTTSPTDICAGQSSVLKVILPGSSIGNYCQPSSYNPLTIGCTYNQITDVSITAASNGTTILSNLAAGGCSVNGSQYNNLGSTYNQNNLTAGQKYNFSITNNPEGYTGYSIWVDFNQDGIYEANEQVYSNYYPSPLATNTGSFIVPITAYSGSTALRIRADWKLAPAASNACATIDTGGEVQDYIITIVGGAAITSYTWTPSSTLSNATVNSPTATPSTTTTYSVTANIGKCPSSVAISTVYVNVPLSASIAATLVAPSAYCTPAYSSGTVFLNYITNVTIGSINNTTGILSSPYYNYYGSTNTNLTAGSAYTITGTVTNGGTEYEAVWIDFNQDGVFEANEKLGEYRGLSFAIPFTVPVSAISGQTRMRVRMVNNTSGIDPCASYTYGDAQDYNVTIVNGVNPNCGGISSNQLTPTIAGGGQPYHFAWAPAAGLSSTTIGTPIANPTTTTTYTLTITDSCGHVGHASQIITVLAAPVIAITPSTPNVCIGGRTSLVASGVTNYYWTASLSLSNTSGSTVAATPTATTIYTVTGNIPGQCFGTDTITIHIIPPPTAKFMPYSTFSVCTGPVTLPLSITGLSPWTIVYNDGVNNHTVTGAKGVSYPLNVNPLATTTYRIRSVTDANGCVSSIIGSAANSYIDSTRKVILYAPKGGSITPALSTICNGSNQTFSLIADTGTHIQWQYTTNPAANSTSWTNYGTLDSTSATLSNITTATYVRAVISVPGCVAVSSTDGKVTIDSSAIKVTVNNTSATTAAISWTPVLGATGYTVVYNGNTITTANVSYVLTGLTPCTSYNVTITSNTSNCGGTRSGSNSFNTGKGNLSLILTQAANYKVTATWSTGVGPYKLYLGSIDNLSSLQVFNVTGTSYTTANAWPGYTVAAYVVDLGSPCTPLAQSTLQQINVAGGNCNTGAPAIVSTATTATTFTVQWSGSSNAGYQFYYKNIAGGLSGGWYSYYTAGNSMTINGRAPASCYAIYVQNSCGTSKGYATHLDTVCTAAVCATPVNLLLSKATCNGFTATWNNVSGATAYQVFMTITSSSGSPIVYSYTVAGSPYTVSIFGRSVPVSVYVKTVNCNGSNGISLSSNAESITTLTTGCKEGSADGSSISAAIANGTFAVYPNPNNGTFKINMSTLSTNSMATLEVIDMLGRTLYTKEVTNNNGVIMETIDMGNALANGLYMVRVRCGNDNHITKLQIQR